MDMIVELLVATLMVLITVGVHAVGLLTLGRIVAAGDARVHEAALKLLNG